MFINPRAAAHLERCRPQAKGEAISQNAMGHNPHAVRELRRVGGDVLSASVLIAFIDLEKVVTDRTQMLRQPIGIGTRFPLVDRRIKSGPAPPSHWNLTRNTCPMETPNRGAIGAKLPQIVQPCSKHHAFGVHLFACIKWKT